MAQLYVADATKRFASLRCTCLSDEHLGLVHAKGASPVMAVAHFSVSIIGRNTGRSAVIAAAYRHCARMEFEREGSTIDYTRKHGLLHEEIATPADAPEWLRAIVEECSVAGASEALWNVVEHIEKRQDAQLAKETTIALPVELSAQQNIALMRDFVMEHITARGMVADWVFHDVPGNPHIHLMTTLRPLTEDGFGAKKVAVRGPDGHPARNPLGKIVYELWAGGIDDFNALRDGWFNCLNRHLALGGLDIRVDGRSFERQGVELTPTIHLGVGTTAIQRKAEAAKKTVTLERVELQEKRRVENARRIEKNPTIVLDRVAREKSVFDARDVASVLHRYIDDASRFQNLMARILNDPQTLRLDRERIDLATGARVPARYTTRELIRLEAGMAKRAIWLSARSPRHGVRDAVLKATFARHDRLSEEQRTAIEHIAGGERIAAVIGRAGAGKTTMMKAARQAWEAAGFRVVGAALAGKAAEGIEKEAGIPSRTLSSWELRWNEGRDHIDEKTVFVLDEAGMVSSRQMALFVEAVTKAGAKLVLIGDPDQLQPIEAGAAFRAIADRIGYAELETIYRQREQWMRDASLDLARGHVDKAVEAYHSRGRMVGADTKDEAISRLIADWDSTYDPETSTLILAHLRRDVRRLNELARARLIARGAIEAGFAFRTADGERSFATGDQIVFLRNEGSIGVKNGMLAKVVEARPGRIVAEIGEGEHRRQVLVEQRFYDNLDHGYATTVHKAQGATVDRVKVLASLSLDRHLTYVAMTRHREDLGVYYGSRSFARAGGLIPLLSRRNAKETTLDYAGGSSASLYRQALAFAEARGLHLVSVARTMARDRLEWTLRQKERLVDLGSRLAVVAAKIGLTQGTTRTSVSTISTAGQIKPMVAGITPHARSVDDVVDEKIAGDKGLSNQWREVSERFRLVYAEPEAALYAMDVHAMMDDRETATRTIAKITTEPTAFGALKGKAGFLAGRTETNARDQALRNVVLLAHDLGSYLRGRGEAEHRYREEELAARRRAAVDIPALSAEAKAVLDRVNAAVDRSDLTAALEQSRSNPLLSAELERFASAVDARFGKRVFLTLAAKDIQGERFREVTKGMSETAKGEIRQAWDAMRAVQRLAAHRQAVTPMREAEVVRKGLGPRLR